MADDKVISVIIPVYNVEKYLDRCVQSVVDQSYSNLEIILVDDGSTDNCPIICDEWTNRDNRIRVIHKKNGGLSDARNAGMAAASGEYISFIDSDDWIEPEMMERLLRAIVQDESDIAACTVKMVWEDGSPGKLLTAQENCVLNREEAQRALLRETLLKQPVWYKLYKTDLVKEIPFAVGKYHEDVFWSYQAIGAAKRVSVIDYPGYNYFQRSDSIMGEGYSLKRLDAIEAKEERQKYLEECFPELAAEGRVNLWFSCLYHGQKALRILPETEKIQAVMQLKETRDRFPINKSDYKQVDIKHRFWLQMESMSFSVTCRFRNMLKIGI